VVVVVAEAVTVVADLVAAMSVGGFGGGHMSGGFGGGHVSGGLGGGHVSGGLGGGHVSGGIRGRHAGGRGHYRGLGMPYYGDYATCWPPEVYPSRRWRYDECY